jgi:outer membrane protein assembly factor BamB
MRGLDPHRTNRSPFVAPRGPVVRWTLDVGAPIALTPAVSGDRVVLGTLGGKVLGVDAGRIAWTFDARDRVYGSPLIVGDVAWVGVDGGSLVSLGVRDGKPRARATTKGDADGAPAPLGDGVVFCAAREVIALDGRGRERWTWKGKRKHLAPPAITDDGDVIVAGQDDRVTRLDGRDGTVKWRVDVGADADGGPSIADDGTIYVGTDGGEVIALEPLRGGVKWRRDVGGFVRGGITMARDGSVIVGTHGPKPAIVALDPFGGVRFRVAVPGTGAKEQGVHGGPIEDAEGTLVFGGQDDRVVALDRDGGTRWALKVDGDVDGTIALAEGVLYVATYGGSLLALADPLKTKGAAALATTPRSKQRL